MLQAKTLLVIPVEIPDGGLGAEACRFVTPLEISI
jgi:hypothetical protein